MIPREPALPIHCPHCQHVVHVPITTLQRGAVGVVCVHCRKQIPLTREFVEAIRPQ